MELEMGRRYDTETVVRRVINERWRYPGFLEDCDENTWLWAQMILRNVFFAFIDGEHEDDVPEFPQSRTGGELQYLVQVLIKVGDALFDSDCEVPDECVMFVRSKMAQFFDPLELDRFANEENEILRLHYSDYEW